MMKLSAVWVGLGILALALVACGGGGTSAQGVLVRLAPDSLSAQEGAEIVVAVRVEPRGRGVSGGELNISFDPDVFAIVNVSPGGLFGPTPLVGAERVDNQTGTLLYALARRGPTSVPTSASIFAEITLQVVEGAPGGQHDVAITSVGLADESFHDIGSIALASATVDI